MFDLFLFEFIICGKMSNFPMYAGNILSTCMNLMRDGLS